MTDYRLFVDKYSPESFNDIKFNHIAAEKLRSCASVINVPHLIIKGCGGSGRKTFANIYIKAKYNLGKNHIKYRTVEIKSGNKTIELQLLYSDYHYQIDPSTHGVYDRLIIQGFIKDIMQTRPISHIPYHIIIINNADRLTHEAQQSLRRTLEKNVNNCRFIFIISQESSLIEALMSRCVQIRLASPTAPQIEVVLEQICSSENILHNKEQLRQIVVFSKRNLSKAINLLQYINLNCSDVLASSAQIDFTDIDINDKYLFELSHELMNAKTPQNLLEIRSVIHDLLVQCVDPLKILKSMFHYIFDYLDQIESSDVKKHLLIQLLSKYENSLKQGSKPIYHLEGFAVGVTNLLNGY